jgi:hypothetical protein
MKQSSLSWHSCLYFLVVVQKCHQYVLHPYNPDLTAHHKATCTGTAAQDVVGVAEPAAEAKPVAEDSKVAATKAVEAVAEDGTADDAPPAAAVAPAAVTAAAPAGEGDSIAAEVAEASEGLAKVSLAE